jgi:hypothetical protein
VYYAAFQGRGITTSHEVLKTLENRYVRRLARETPEVMGLQIHTKIVENLDKHIIANIARCSACAAKYIEENKLTEYSPIVSQEERILSDIENCTREIRQQMNAVNEVLSRSTPSCDLLGWNEMLQGAHQNYLENLMQIKHGMLLDGLERIQTLLNQSIISFKPGGEGYKVTAAHFESMKTQIQKGE